MQAWCCARAQCRAFLCHSLSFSACVFSYHFLETLWDNMCSGGLLSQESMLIYNKSEFTMYSTLFWEKTYRTDRNGKGSWLDTAKVLQGGWWCLVFFFKPKQTKPTNNPKTKPKQTKNPKHNQPKQTQTNQDLIRTLPSERDLLEEKHPLPFQRMV